MFMIWCRCIIIGSPWCVSILSVFTYKLLAGGKLKSNYLRTHGRITIPALKRGAKIDWCNLWLEGGSVDSALLVWNSSRIMVASRKTCQSGWNEMQVWWKDLLKMLSYIMIFFILFFAKQENLKWICCCVFWVEKKSPQMGLLF